MPEIAKSRDGFVRVSGIFYRTIADALNIDPIAGSIAAGRYSRPNQKTLYMSSSEDGVRAAMQAHPAAPGEVRSIWPLVVEADSVADLRDDAVFLAIGMQRDDALSSWQDKLAKGQEPSSWSVRTALEGIGATGLIDPSRKAPGLWHLVLFRWNQTDEPQVQLGR